MSKRIRQLQITNYKKEEQNTSDKELEDDLNEMVNENVVKKLEDLELKDEVIIDTIYENRYGFTIQTPNNEKYYCNYQINQFLRKYIDRKGENKRLMNKLSEFFDNYKLIKLIKLTCKAINEVEVNGRKFQNRYFDIHYV